MFKIVVDTNTVPASPTLYADIEKTQALPRVIELVQGFRGKVRVYFVGEHVPSETASLGLYVRPMNVKEKAFQTEGAAREIDEGGNVYFDVNLEADTAALSVALASSENVVMRAGLVSTDSVDGLDTQIEWQINLAVSASSIGYGANPPVSPTAIERHNADETAHPFILDKIRSVETELLSVSELKTEVSELKTEVSEVKSEVDVIKSNYVTTDTHQVITGHKIIRNVVCNATPFSICSPSPIVASFSSSCATPPIIGFITGTCSARCKMAFISVPRCTGTVALTRDVTGAVTAAKSEIRSEISELAGTVETEISELKTEISEVTSELSELAETVTSNYSEVKTELSEVNSEVDVIKSAYVTKGTAQEITGKKTFASSPTSMQTFWGRASALKLKNCATPFVTITGEGSDNSEFSIRFQNKNGTLALSCDVAGTASEIRSEISELETELSENYSELKTEISEVNSDVGVIKSNYVTLDTCQAITGRKVFINNSFASPSISFCSASPIVSLFQTSNGAVNPMLGFKVGTGTQNCKGFVLQIPRCAGTIALTKNITTCTTAVKSELRCELPDVSNFATLTGANTFTGSNWFNSSVDIKGTVIDEGRIHFQNQGFFTTCACGYSINLPKASGTLVVDSQLTNLTSNLSAICKTTVSNYGTITPTAGTLYFLTNS